MHVTSRKSVLLIAANAALVASAGHAAPITADGNFADWGIRANGTAAGFMPTANVGILYVVEDQGNATTGS